MLLNCKQIREITTEGIRYINQHNVEQVISFAQCYENYIKERLSPETWEDHKKVNQQTDLDWDRYVARINTYKVIGARNVLTPPWADGPYIEFYSQPRLKFKFETRDEWDAIVEAITDAGHKLFDQS